MKIKILRRVLEADGDADTYWRSDDVQAGTPEWLKVDFGASVQVGSVFIDWEGKDYAEVYEVQLSENDLDWTTVVSATKSDKGTEEHAFAAVSARYVRVYMTEYKKSSVKILEFEIFCAEQAVAKRAVLSRELNSSRRPSQTAGVQDFALHQNYPNPFNPSANIRFDLLRESHVTIKVYDLVGREVATLVSGRYQAGAHTVTWRAGNLAGGIYIYEMRAGRFVERRRMILIR